MSTVTKTCFKCQQEKMLTEFYKHPQMGDGYLNKCKECTKRDARVTRRKRSDYYRAYDRKRGNRQGAEYFEKYKAQQPEKYKAHVAAGNAIRDGRLIREPCFMCGTEKVEAHHVDYSKPLDVIWLCPMCHKRIHAYERRAEAIISNE